MLKTFSLLFILRSLRLLCPVALVQLLIQNVRNRMLEVAIIDIPIIQIIFLKLLALFIIIWVNYHKCRVLCFLFFHDRLSAKIYQLQHFVGVVGMVNADLLNILVYNHMLNLFLKKGVKSYKIWGQNCS